MSIDTKITLWLPVFFLLLIPFAAAQNLGDGLVNYWDGDGTLCEEDREGQDANLNSIGGATCVPGKIGNAYSMAGSDSIYWESPNTGAPVGNEDRTMCAWIYNTDKIGTASHVFVAYGSVAIGQAFGIAGFGNTCSGSSNCPSSYIHGHDITFGNDEFTTNTWEHWCLAYDNADDTTHYYHNGVKTNDDTYTLNTGGGVTRNLRLSRSLFPSASASGAIDEIGLWNRELSATEVANLYNNGQGLSYETISTPAPEINFSVENSYWIEDTTHDVWVKMNLTAGDNVFYIEKTPGFSPDGNAVFEFFDTFDSLDFTNKWASADPGIYTAVPGELQGLGTGTSNLVRTQSTFNDFTAVARLKASIVDAGSHPYFFSGEGTNFDNDVNIDGYQGQHRHFVDATTSSTGTFLPNTYYQLELDVPAAGSATVNSYNDDRTLISSTSGTPRGRTGYVQFLQFTGGIVNVDWVYLRKHTDAPTVTVIDQGSYYQVDVTATQAQPNVQVRVPGVATSIDESLRITMDEPTPVNTQWYNTTFQYRNKITVYATQVQEDLTNFPIYVDLGTLPQEFFDNVQADGGDIRITLADGITEVPREVVTIDTAANTGELHFKGGVSSTTDTPFYIYYGNSAAQNYETFTQYGRDNVWADYTAVWHLSENPSSTPQIIDSTGNGNLGTVQGSMSSIDSLPSIMGKALDFDGVDDSILVTDSPDLEPLGHMTISLWTQPTGNTATDYSNKGPIGKWDTEAQYIIQNPSGNLKFVFTSMHGGQRSDAAGTSNPGNNWTHVAAVWDGTGKVFVNAVLEGTAPFKPGNMDVGSTPFMIGTYHPTANTHWKGLIDEVRIAASAYSETWVQTEYNNQNNPQTFYTVGAVEEGPLQNTTGSATEEGGRTAILTGLQNSGISFISVNDHRVQVLTETGDFFDGVFDVYVESGNKRWAFNYEETGSLPPFIDLPPVFYVWQETNLTVDEITTSVTALITSS